MRDVINSTNFPAIRGLAMVGGYLDADFSNTTYDACTLDHILIRHGNAQPPTTTTRITREASLSLEKTGQPSQIRVTRHARLLPSRHASLRVTRHLYTHRVTPEAVAGQSADGSMKAEAGLSRHAVSCRGEADFTTHRHVIPRDDPVPERGTPWRVV